MGVVIPQVITEDRASGAQVIDGSLRSSSDNDRLYFTPSSTGNRKTWTWSGWIKRSELTSEQHFFQSWNGSGNVLLYMRFDSNDTMRIKQFSGSDDLECRTNAVFRDTSAWYHVVMVMDTTQATSSERTKIYVNGELQSLLTANYPSQDLNTFVNLQNYPHELFRNSYNSSISFNGYMSNVYLVDGQALAPTDFGFTDPLTNTWRPKKYIGTYGTNGFYLPMDGNSPIGEDKSGNGNNWTAVNFGGSNTIEKATGAFPILNTVNGGNVAVPGIFGSKVSKTLTTTASTNTSNGFVFENEGTKPTLSFVRGATYTFDYSASTAHPLRFATAADAVGSTEYTDGTDTSVANTVKITVPHNAPDTLYYYCTNHGGMGNSISVTTDEKVADPYAWKNVLALPLVGSKDDVSNQINSGSTTKTITVTGNASASNVQNNFYGGSFNFDGYNDYLRITANNDFHFGVPSGNDNDFTIEWWKYWAALDNPNHTTEYQTLWSNNYTSSPGLLIQTGNGDGKYRVFFSSGSVLFQETNAPTVGRWYHYALVRNGTTVTMYRDGVPNGSATSSSTVGNNSAVCDIGQGGGDYYEYGYIQDFRVYKGVAKYTSNFIPASTNPDVLPDTPSGVAGGSALATLPESTTEGAVAFDGSGDNLAFSLASGGFGSGDFTLEYFVYHNTLTNYQTHFGVTRGSTGFNVGTDAAGRFVWYDNNGGASRKIEVLGAIGTNKWYHWAFVRSGSTITGYLDGRAIATYTSSVDYSGTTCAIGSLESNSEYINGFISNFNINIGTALYTSDFTPPTAPLTSVANTKLLCCQSTTSATAAAVAPGSITANGNAIASKFSPFMPDNINSVRGQESGWNTLNPLQLVAASGGLSDGNLKSRVTPPTTGFCGSTGTLAVSSGKWYYEVLVTAASGMHGWVGSNWSKSENGGLWYNSARGYGIYGVSGNKFNNGSNSAYGSAFANGDIISCALDLDNGFIMWAKNGVWYNGGNPLTGANAAYTGLTEEFVTANFAQAANAGNDTPAYYNFGQKPFKYAPPEGFKTLCLANLPRPTAAAVRPDKYFDTLIWSGTGGSSGATRSLTGLGFSPDLVWGKVRTSSGVGHIWMDSVRGVGTGKYLQSNTTNAEGTSGPNESLYGYLSSLDSAGFTVTNGTSTFDNWNKSGDTYVAWCWKAGGAAVSNSDGSITSQVSANQDAGFSIVTWTGDGNTAQIGHGLSSAPDFVILKYRNTASNWSVWHQRLVDNDRLVLNSTQAATSDGGLSNFNSSTFNISSSYNNNGNTYVAYCWHDVPGFSKFGNFTGNGSADGPFINLGFRPAWIMLKRLGGVESWQLVDTTRRTYNPMTNYMSANTSNAEASAVDFWDQLSNGFKLRNGNVYVNGAEEYIFAAFAEAPTNNLFGGQANAR